VRWSARFFCTVAISDASGAGGAARYDGKLAENIDQDLPALKMYSLRYVHYRFSALTVNFGTQPTLIESSRQV